MSFRLPVETNKALAELKSSYRLTHSKKAGEEGRSTIIAQIIDLLTKEPYAEATGPNEAQAVINALAVAQTTERPMTPGQAIQRVAKLEDEKKSLRAELDRLRRDNKKPEEPSMLGKTAAQHINVKYADMPSSELRSKLRESGVAPPDGDLRTLTWREKAISMLEHEDQLEDGAEEASAEPATEQLIQQ